MSETTAEQQPEQPEAQAPAAEDPKPETTEQGNPGEDALGDAGKKALDRMKAERNAAREEAKQLQQQQQQQLDAIAKALGLKSDAEAPDPAQITAELEESRRLAAENAAALTRYRLAVEKEVPAHLVEFVTGSTAEEVETSIEKVLSAFSSAKPNGPRPDPSQGVQGAPASLDALIAEAEKAGNTREVIRLKARKALPQN